MKEYNKINNIFKFDEKYRTIIGMTDTYEKLKNIEWIGTEKVDGTNIRIYWDGHEIKIGGRTNKAQIPPHLMEYLTNTFLTKEMEYVFEQMFEDKEVYLFGEGYGFKIQANGGSYFEDNKEVGFILFDVNINGYDLTRDNVNDIAEKLGLKSVPVLFKGTLDEAIKFVKEHPYSSLGSKTHELEGLVLQPSILLYDAQHKPIKCKCKIRDIEKLKATIEGKIEFNPSMIFTYKPNKEDLRKAFNEGLKDAICNVEKAIKEASISLEIKINKQVDKWFFECCKKLDCDLEGLSIEEICEKTEAHNITCYKTLEEYFISRNGVIKFSKKRSEFLCEVIQNAEVSKSINDK